MAETSTTLLHETYAALNLSLMMVESLAAKIYENDSTALAALKEELLTTFKNGPLFYTSRLNREEQEIILDHAHRVAEVMFLHIGSLIATHGRNRFP